MKHFSDFLIIGSGIAGLSLALKLSKKGTVTLLTKKNEFDSNTNYAQGGIAAVLDKEDSFEEHIQDTLVAGAGLCRKEVVDLVVTKGPDLVKELITLGVNFSKNDDNSYHLTKEGGHGKRRVIHAHDLTGHEVIRALLELVKKDKNINFKTNMFAIDLITSDKHNPSFNENSCYGCYVYDEKKDQVDTYLTKQTFLCTGGLGKIYLYTSNPDIATGDGVAMGYRAGAKVANLEFTQFHPTCLYSLKSKTFLITEALRGEGAVLKDINKNSFMEKYHPLKSLAPRDIVARAIDMEIKNSGKDFVYLDATLIGAEKLKNHFPNIYETCLKEGIDITKDMIPVVPAAHYSCGGLVTDLNGQTNIKNLFAIGEVACTGLHGANRLASNSLLEALVFAQTASEKADNKVELYEYVKEWNQCSKVLNDEKVVLTHTWDEIRRLMWNYVGIVRTDKRLERALIKINQIKEELNHYYHSYQVDSYLLEVRNLAEVAHLTILCALKRKESIGIHFNSDYPKKSENSKDNII